MKKWTKSRPMAAGILLGAFVVFTHDYSNHVLPSHAQQITTEKDPKIIAAEQLSFVLCKEKEGRYKAHHDKDMRKVLDAYGINTSILENKNVKLLAQKYVNDGACSFFNSYSRIGEMATAMQQKGESIFKTSYGWQREVIYIMAEGECRTQSGEFSNQERENFFISQIEKLTFPENLSEEEFTSTLRKNVPAVAWLASERKKHKDCSWKP